jgi:hypothetical protein
MEIQDHEIRERVRALAFDMIGEGEFSDDTVRIS